MDSHEWYIDIDFLEIWKSVRIVAFLPHWLTSSPEHACCLRTRHESWHKLHCGRGSLSASTCSRTINTALPEKHTRRLYDRLSRKECSVLARLRTGVARLNTHLHRTRASTTDQCEYGQAQETVDDFFFRCRRWTAHRTEMLPCTQTGRGSMSPYLGGKAPTDDEKWAPNMDTVRATVKFAIATGRLDAD
jgi:hypothetical protein